MNLEDTHADILHKARRGLGLTREEAESAAGLPPGSFALADCENPDLQVLRRLAAVLNLSPAPLEAIARQMYKPSAGQLPKNFLMFTTPYGDMTVNSYLVWDGQSGRAAAFDTGADCDPILEVLDSRKLKLEEIFLTHTHGDHIFDLDRLVAKTKARAWTPEPLNGAETFLPGRGFALGDLKISSRLTCGHSVSGATYVIRGLSRPLAVVGDALFAGSMGGGKISYADALRTSRAEILSLPLDTLIAPGHGPLTTVALELENNPFFRCDEK